MAGRFLEDFALGEVIASGEEYEITPENLAVYAAEYDPQPIHLDAEAAAAGMFGGIVSSGWQTASVSMRPCGPLADLRRRTGGRRRHQQLPLPEAGQSGRQAARPGRGR